MIEQIQPLLVNNGFAVISKITLNQDLLNLNSTFAQVRQLLVHLKGKAVIVDIQETTIDDKITISTQFHFAYLPAKQLCQMCFDREAYMKAYYIEENDTFLKKIIPGFNKKFIAPDNFSLGESYSCREYNYFEAGIYVFGKQITPESLLLMIQDIIGQVDPYLGQYFIDDTSATIYMKSRYLKIENDNVWSDQFDWKYFKHLTQKIQPRQ